MSSHREAPEISKDPVADSSDLYAFVSPDNPDTRHHHRELRPAPAARRRPELLRVRQRRAVPDLHRQRRRRRRGHHLPVPVLHTADRQGPNDIFLYNTGQINHLTDTTWNRKQFYRVTRVDHHGTNVIAEWLPCPPCNVGQQLDPRLRRPHDPGDPDDRLEQVLRGAARRRLLRRPRLDLRPRRAAPLRAGLPAQGHGRGRHQLARQPERAQHRDAGADHRADEGLDDPDVVHRRELDHRRVHDGQPPEGPPLRRLERVGRERDLRPVDAGLAPRDAAHQRGHHPDGRQGLLEHAVAEERRAVLPVLRPPVARGTAERAVPRCVPEPRGVHGQQGQYASGPRRGAAHGRAAPLPGVPELHRADEVRHAAAQRGDPADRAGLGEHPRRRRRRQRGLPERAACVRRRRQRRAEGRRRGPAARRGPVLHARRGCGCALRRGRADHRADHGREPQCVRAHVPDVVPVPLRTPGTGSTNPATQPIGVAG